MCFGMAAAASVRATARPATLNGLQATALQVVRQHFGDDTEVICAALVRYPKRTLKELQSDTDIAVSVLDAPCTRWYYVPFHDWCSRTGLLPSACVISAGKMKLRARVFSGHNFQRSVACLYKFICVREMIARNRGCRLVSSATACSSCCSTIS